VEPSQGKSKSLRGGFQPAMTQIAERARRSPFQWKSLRGGFQPAIANGRAEGPSCRVWKSLRGGFGSAISRRAARKSLRGGFGSAIV